MSIPDSLDALLTREATAAALTEAGFPTAAPTLATKATRGGGPMYRKWSTRPLYRWGDALAWAQDRLGPTVSSTSEAETIRDRASRTAPIVPEAVENPAPTTPTAEVPRAGGGTPLYRAGEPANLGPEYLQQNPPFFGADPAPPAGGNDLAAATLSSPPPAHRSRDRGRRHRPENHDSLPGTGR